MLHLLVALAVGVTPSNPWSAGGPLHCVSSSGHPVEFVPNPMLPELGQVFFDRPGAPRVEFNPGLLGRLPPQMQLLWVGHACAHFVLADAHREEAADCWALQSLKQHGLVTREQVLAMQSIVENAPSVPWAHWPGPSRAWHFLECYDRRPGDVLRDGWRVPYGQGWTPPSAPPVPSEPYQGVKRWRFCSHIPGVSAPTSSGHVSQRSCEKERARLQERQDYVVSECVLTSSERCSLEKR